MENFLDLRNYRGGSKQPGQIPKLSFAMACFGLPELSGTLGVMTRDIARLGRYVAERRQRLGVSQVDVWRSGGPSNSTLTGLESGAATAVSQSTLKKLDVALRWAPGSAQAVLEGSEPIEAQLPPPLTTGGQVTPDRRGDSRLSLDDGWRELAALIEDRDRLREELERAPGPRQRGAAMVEVPHPMVALLADCIEDIAAATARIPERDATESGLAQAVHLARLASRRLMKRADEYRDLEELRARERRLSGEMDVTDLQAELRRVSARIAAVRAAIKSTKSEYELARREGETEERRRRRIEGEPWDQADPEGPEGGA